MFRAISPEHHRARRFLTVLDVSRNSLGNMSATALAGFLAGSCRLLRLSVAWNHLRGAAAVELCQGIGVNTSIHVRPCRVRASFLVHAHTKCPCSQTLDVSWNGIGGSEAEPSAACIALARALFTNNALVHVNLSHNRLDERECSVIGEALKVRSCKEGVGMQAHP